MTSQHRDAPVAVERRHQSLGDRAPQGRREHHPRLLLQVWREEVDDPVDRLRRVQRVERGEHEVAGLGGGERGSDSLLVAHLADQDHVRVLPQHPPHCAGEALGVLADLALVDDRELVAVQVLDRVLERNHVRASGSS